MTLEYDGSDFCGWQLQPAQRSVQGELERALARLTGESIRVTAAGRTDAGVHALGQVVNFHTASTLPAATFVRGTNALLPADVRVRDAGEAAAGFSARYDACARAYRYRIALRPRAIGRQYAWYVPWRLDLAAMQEAAGCLVGEHDFVSFCQAGAGLDHYRCQVHEARWQEGGEELAFDICANRFVHNMVRIIVGTCIEAGRGALAPAALTAILAARDRRAAGRTAPAHGLYLLRVDYQEEEP